ncbi:MAG TPA: FRG domain-containing protein [Pyrinomonadaceae bacterium]|nr:FRG domain-containing protein [Pyrinomonadaceae bacterium]
MKPIPITNFADLYDFVAQGEDDRLIFRGVTNAAKHKLVPSIGRKPRRKGETLKAFEQRIFRLFKERALPYLTHQPTSDWEWLAIAQHHGLPTRLLDWSYNPLAACYFAVEKAFDGDSALYAFSTSRIVRTDVDSPFSINAIAKFRPPHITQRIIAQSGVFTVHPTPEEEFHGSGQVKIGLIANKVRKLLKRDLYKFGVNESTLFPGLDGIARDLEWRHTDVH